MTAVFLSENAKLKQRMSNNKQTRRVSSHRLRAILTDIANEICRAQDKFTFSLTGNTFEIHLDGGSVNITINESLTKSLCSAKEGGQL